MTRITRAQLMGGLVLLTLGILIILHIFYIVELFTSWPLILIVIGLSFFPANPHTLAGWVIGGIGAIFLAVNLVILFFPDFEAWSGLVGPIIMIIIGILLLHRYYHGKIRKAPKSPPPAPPPAGGEAPAIPPSLGQQPPQQSAG